MKKFDKSYYGVGREVTGSLMTALDFKITTMLPLIIFFVI